MRFSIFCTADLDLSGKKRDYSKRENKRSLQDMTIRGRKANEGGNTKLMLDLQQQNQY